MGGRQVQGMALARATAARLVPSRPGFGVG